MDPDKNLADQRRLSARIHAIVDKYPADARDLQDTAAELAELVDSLDAWIRRGGFLPAAWNRGTDLDEGSADYCTKEADRMQAAAEKYDLAERIVQDDLEEDPDRAMDATDGYRLAELVLAERRPK